MCPPTTLRGETRDCGRRYSTACQLPLLVSDTGGRSLQSKLFIHVFCFGLFRQVFISQKTQQAIYTTYSRSLRICWHARHGRGSTFPSAIRSARSSMQCGRVPALHGRRTVSAPVRSCLPDHPHMDHPRPVHSKNMAHPPTLLPVCLAFAILHLVRSPRHLPPTARPPKVAICRAVGCRPHRQRRQSSRGAVVGRKTTK